MGVQIKLTDGMNELLTDDGVRDYLRELGGRVLDRARDTAPVATGAYRDSLQMTDGTTDRAVVNIGSPLPYATRVEASTGHLARALDAAGGE